MTYEVKLQNFSGPLDLLLSLIEERKLDITEISLAGVTDQFLEYLSEIKGTFTANTAGYQRILADFLSVASRLILIKSRMLLPNLVLTQEEEGDIKDLSLRLEAYRKVKELAETLKKFGKNSQKSYSRQFLPDTNIIFYPPKSISSELLLQYYQKSLQALPQIEKLTQESIERIMTLEEKMAGLVSKMNQTLESSFDELAASKGSKARKIDVILTFLAVLMLFKQRIFEISQDKIFGQIKVKTFSSDGL